MSDCLRRGDKRNPASRLMRFLKPFYLTQISDLKPLRGMPVEGLNIHATKVTDLSPLKECKQLRVLILIQTEILDLSPLKELPLDVIQLDFKPEHHTEALRSIKTLREINKKPVAEFWKEVDEKSKQ